jgi:hypothetical protein
VVGALSFLVVISIIAVQPISRRLRHEERGGGEDLDKRVLIMKDLAAGEGLDDDDEVATTEDSL